MYALLVSLCGTVETAAGATTVANASITGWAKRMALAAETLAGAATSANPGLAGWLLRCAVGCEAASGTSPAGFNRDIPGYLARIRASIAAGFGGLYPLVVTDFKNGVYSIGGASVAVTDILTQDVPNWGTFVPATDISAGVGWISGAPIFLHSVLASTGMLSGFTAVMTYEIVGAVPGYVSVELVDFPAYAVEQAFYTEELTSTTGHSVVTDHIITAENTWSGAGVHKAAFTISNARISTSTNGSAVATIDPVNNAPTDLAMVISGTGLICRRIDFYAPQPDSALPGLST